MKRYGSFFLLALALAIAPGPDILFVLAQALAQGWQAGACVTAGLCSGLVFHVTLAAVGVAAALKRYPWLFKAVTWFGAAYLVWLGFGAWREAHVIHLAADGSSEAAFSAGALYLRGVIMNVLNPKVMLFFLALVPRFVRPESGRVVTQFMMLGLLFALAAALVFLAVSLGGGMVSSLLREHASATVGLQYFAALVMFGLAGWIGWMNVRREG